MGELCARVERSISDAFPDEVWVRGAISGISRSANGHVYFDLVDPGELGKQSAATLPVALFAQARQRVNAILRKTQAVRMGDGVEIQIRGAVNYYPKQGRVQLIMSLIDPAFTLGQLEAAKAELMQKLKTEGLLDANRAIPFPALPLRVGLVTSTGSAAEADFVNHLRSTGLPFEITVFDARVQGDEAPSSIASAIAHAGDAPEIGEPSLDVIAVVRGGGAKTDLAAFDHESVARAIATSRLPVLVGVGHETDRSVADDVAHTSAKTPTACASVIIDAVALFDHRVNVAAERIATTAINQLGRSDLRLSEARSRLARVAIESVAERQASLETIGERISTKASRVVELADLHLDHQQVRVRSLDPAVALARGWSITQRPDGSVVTSVDDIVEGDTLTTTLANGTISSIVLTKSSQTTPTTSHQSGSDESDSAQADSGQSKSKNAPQEEETS